MNGLRAIEKHGGVACPFLPAGKRGQILFFVWVDLSEHKWVILAERRGLGKSPGGSARSGLISANRPSLRDDRSVGAPADGPVKSPSRQLDKNVMLRPVMP